MQKIGDSMTTRKTSKISLNIFDDKRFYVNNIKSYPHDKELYSFKRDLINRIREAASPIMKLYKDRDKDRDVDKLICEAGSMINDIKELTIDSNRKLIDAAIILYMELL